MGEDTDVGDDLDEFNIAISKLVLLVSTLTMKSKLQFYCPHFQKVASTTIIAISASTSKVIMKTIKLRDLIMSESIHRKDNVGSTLGFASGSGSASSSGSGLKTDSRGKKDFKKNSNQGKSKGHYKRNYSVKKRANAIIDEANVLMVRDNNATSKDVALAGNMSNSHED